MTDRQNPRLGHPPDTKGHVTPEPHGAPSGGAPPIQGPPGEVNVTGQASGMNLTAMILIILAVAALVAVPIVLSTINSPAAENSTDR